MALPEIRKDLNDPDFFIPDTPQRERSRPVDAADAELTDHHYIEPEVNRLKEWAQRANAELTEEAILNAHIRVLPLPQAIALMTVSSLALWGIAAAAVWQLF